MAVRIASPVFVGRAAELAAFEQLLARAVEGEGGALLVAGEAGIGKSRLISEFERRARRVDALVLVGECVELTEGELAFAPIVSALRSVVDDQIEAPLRSTLAALWPSLGEPAPASREQLFEGIYRVLAGLAATRPTLLVIEDLHWVDRSSRDLLAFLVHNARRDRLLVVATYRSDELHRRHPLRPFLTELERSGRAERFELEPLGRSELADQLGAIAGERPPAQLVDDILSRSEGNPFFAEELLARAGSDGGAELPGSLREALLLRIERLSPPTQQMLRTAAVVGRSADYRLLAQVSGLDHAELAQALREATENHVFVPVAHGVAYGFRHALLREAMYDDALPAERLQLHAAIARALSADPELATAGAAAELAYHWHASGDLRSALKTSVQAAAEAERMYAYSESLAHVERALSLWDRVEDPARLTSSDQFDLLLRGSQVADWGGDARRALALAESARRIADERTDPLRAAQAEMRIGRTLHQGGRGEDAIEHLAKASALVPAEPPSLDRAEALAAEGRALMLAGRFQDARARLEEARQIASPLGSPAIEASVLNSLAIVYSRFGEYERAVASGQEGLRIARDHELREEVMRGYVNGSQALDDAGRIGEALAMGREGIEIARRLGMDRASGDQLRVQAGWRLARMGRLSEAEQIVRPALDAATTPFNVAGAKTTSGRIAAEQGRFEVAGPLLEEAWQLMQRSGGFQLIGPALADMTSLHIWRGQLEKARERVAEGLSRFAAKEPDLMYNSELFWLAVRIEAECDEPDPGRARSVLASMDEAIASYPGDGAPPEALAFRLLARAELTRITGEPNVESWREAGDALRSVEQAYRAAYADFRAAEALALSGAAPDEPLRAAHEVAIKIGARPFQDRIEGLARKLGIALEAARPRSPRRAERLLATVLFTDVVGSTARAAELGDQKWRQLLDRHDAIVRREVGRAGGTVIQFVGDGSLSTFDGPGRAIVCAKALREAFATLGIELRAGVHTGEIELRGEDIGGIGVHIGARVAAHAGPSEILVSQTVKDLVAGSAAAFEERGTHELKGVPGSWRLYAVI